MSCATYFGLVQKYLKLASVNHFEVWSYLWLLQEIGEHSLYQAHSENHISKAQIWWYIVYKQKWHFFRKIFTTHFSIKLFLSSWSNIIHDALKHHYIRIFAGISNILNHFGIELEILNHFCWKLPIFKQLAGFLGQKIVPDVYPTNLSQFLF